MRSLALLRIKCVKTIYLPNLLYLYFTFCRKKDKKKSVLEKTKTDFLFFVLPNYLE